MDKETRNLIQRATQAARALLEQEFGEQLEGVFDIQLDGMIAGEPGSHLDAAQRVVRTKLVAAIEHLSSSGQTIAEAVTGYLREAAFTTLNRFVALKMLEARGLVQECISRGEQSSGFKEFTGLAPGLIQLPNHGYRLYIDSLFDEIGSEVRVLFDRRDAASLLWPRRQALLDLLDVLNAQELAATWGEDETIGWVYQYYNDPAERKRMRDESAAPRNSRELAVRNQFFTPRYVVEFLTDNALGRIWYEMTRGQTRLRDQCLYLVRRPNEIFLRPGETAPKLPEQEGDLSQDDLLHRPVQIPHRPLKDPREIRMLDPACGSMHFGLYAFDLFQVIYEEAWDLDLPAPSGTRTGGEDLKPLCDLYATKEDYLRDVPRLILEHNIHGIDIDPRAVQIAGLSLWLRAQRAWQQQRLPRQDRPRIRRSNVVCAEPMPGEEALLEGFIAAQLSATPELRLLGQLVRRVFESMRLAGEAGSLLKIEDEIAAAVREAKQLRLAGPTVQLGFFDDEPGRPGQLGLGLDLGGITDEAFWEQAEERIYDALRTFAESAGGSYQRRLFVDDAARGFAFIDLCRQRYDLALMNPPFGDASLPSKPYIEDTYGDTKGDVYKAFVECFNARLVPAGYLGIISSRTGFFLGQSEDWRTRVVLRLFRPIVLADLGSGVLDAMVEVAAYVLRSLSAAEARDLTLSLVPVLNKVVRDKQDRFSLPKWQAARDGLKRHQAAAELEHLEAEGFIRHTPGGIVRYTPVWQVVKEVTAPPEPVFPPLVCVRALADEDKSASILAANNSPGASTNVFITNPGAFSRISGSPFSYWISDAVRSRFIEFLPLQANGREAVIGASTKDDFRFLRLLWEIDETARAVVGADNLVSAGAWVPIAKGGAHARFFANIYLAVNWRSNGAELKAMISEYRGSRGWGYQWSAELKPRSFSFRPGITWSRRTTTGLSLRVLPRVCMFGDKGPAILSGENDTTELLLLLSLTNSAAFTGLVSLQVAAGDAAARSYEIGILQKTPLPRIDGRVAERMVEMARSAWSERRSTEASGITSQAFILPALVMAEGQTLVDRANAWAARVCKSEATVAAIQAEIDDLTFRLYGLDEGDRAALTTTLGTEATGNDAAEAGEGEEAETATADVPALVADLLAYALGCAFGRWDIRYATGERPAPEAPDPFAPLPVCPPGQLQNAQGLPASPEDLPSGYPLDIPWDGILVDDAGHDRDVAARSRRVFDVVFADAADAAWREAAETLEGRGDDLRASIARSLFADHIKRYSKSRRKAPIYWQLATPSASYSVWLYYHRFTRDTFYKVLNDYVTPKLQHEERKLTGLMQDAGGNPTASQRKDIAEQEAFVGELRAFREEVARVAPLWNPDLNDGVIINFAPLWRLVPQHRAWQKQCKACWDRLVAGDYDWAHLAMHLWPERVVAKCAKDRSLAIAHCLEGVCWEEDDDGKWQPLKVPHHEIDQLIAERISAAVKDALKSLLDAPAPVTSRRGGRRSPARTKTRRKSAGSSSATADTAVLDTVKRAVAQSSTGISKADALAVTSLTNSQWNAAVKVLLADGSVTKTGAGRGTRYHSATGN